MKLRFINFESRDVSRFRLGNFELVEEAPLHQF